MSRAAHTDPAVSVMEMTLLWLYFFPADNTAAVHTQRVGFNRQEQDVYLLPILVVDSGPPALSSTGTLTIRVCGCDSTGAIQSCNSTAYAMSATLSPGALIALLVCILILVGECCPGCCIGSGTACAGAPGHSVEKQSSVDLSVCGNAMGLER